jgi:hypothetical protein
MQPRANRSVRASTRAPLTCSGARYGIFPRKVIFILVHVLGPLLVSMHYELAIWFVDVFLTLGLTWVSLRMTGRNPLTHVRLEYPGTACIALGLLCGMLCYHALALPLAELTVALVPPEMQEHLLSCNSGYRPSFDLLLAAPALAVVVPFCEEYFYRGVLQQGLSRPGRSPVPAILIAAFVFSATHLEPLGFLPRMAIGALAGYLVFRAGSLWPGVAVHAGNNLISVALFFRTQDSYFEVDDVPEWDTSLLHLAIGVPLLAILAWAAMRTSRLGPNLDLPPAPDRASRSFHRVAAPWLAGALGLLVLMFPADPRGTALDFVDRCLAPLPELDTTPELSAGGQRRETALYNLREQAQSGEASIGEYFWVRWRLGRDIERGLEQLKESKPASASTRAEASTAP